MMTATARRLAGELTTHDLPVYGAEWGNTRSHQFAVCAAAFGGGQAGARRLRTANLLTCGIDLPIEPVEGDVNGLRIGTPELARLGMTERDMPDLASLLARALDRSIDTAGLATEVTQWRSRFSGVHYTAGNS